MDNEAGDKKKKTWFLPAFWRWLTRPSGRSVEQEMQEMAKDPMKQLERDIMVERFRDQNMGGPGL